MRKYPKRLRLEVDRDQVIKVGRQIKRQMKREWFKEFEKWLNGQEQAIVTAWRNGFVGRNGRTIGEVSERYAGKLEVFGMVKTWFRNQVNLAKEYERRKAEEEAQGKAA